MSMAGLEPARISPHAPQTCAYTDSATSTQTILFNFQSLFCFVLVAEQTLSLLPSPQKQHLVAFSSAECHIDTNDFIQFSKFILFCPRGGANAFAFALSSKATFSCFLVGRVPHRHKRFYSIFKVYFVLSSWRSKRFRFCPLLKSNI